MPTLINSNDRTVYSVLPLLEVKELILKGDPIDIYWYETSGRRHDEHILMTEFTFLSEEVRVG